MTEEERQALHDYLKGRFLAWGRANFPNASGYVPNPNNSGSTNNNPSPGSTNNNPIGNGPGNNNTNTP